jgi:hypothetical protein
MSTPALEQTGAYVPNIEDTMPGHLLTEGHRPDPVGTSEETGRPVEILPGVSPLEAAQTAQKAFADAHRLHSDDSQPSEAVRAVDDKLRDMSVHYMDRLAGGLSMYKGEHGYAAPEVREAPSFTVSEQQLVYSALEAQLPAHGEPRLPKEHDDRIEAAGVLTWLHGAPEEQ